MAFLIKAKAAELSPRALELKRHDREEEDGGGSTGSEGELKSSSVLMLEKVLIAGSKRPGLFCFES